MNQNHPIIIYTLFITFQNYFKYEDLKQINLTFYLLIKNLIKKINKLLYQKK